MHPIYESLSYEALASTPTLSYGKAFDLKISTPSVRVWFNMESRMVLVQTYKAQWGEWENTKCYEAK